MGQTLFWMGQFTPAQTHLDLSCSLYDPARYPLHAVPYFGVDIAVHALGISTLNLPALGFPDQALDRVERAVALARELAHPFSLCFALFQSSGVYGDRDVTAALKFIDVTIHLAEEQGFQEMLGFAILNRGWLLVLGGQTEEGITQLRQGLDSIRGLDGVRTVYLALLALGYSMVGRVDEGFAAIAEAMSLVESTGVRVFEAYLYWVEGELTLKRSEARLNSKIKVEADARRRSAKWYELSATMSLAQLLSEQGRRDEARTMLAEVYNWFTEGFDTAALKNAKALLDELST
jgi:tetratricopeptide (TPR) repeat protein